jgi:hypothetical protein
MPRTYFTRAAQRAGTEAGVVRAKQIAADLAPVIAKLRAEASRARRASQRRSSAPFAHHRHRRVACDIGCPSAGSDAGMMARSPRSASPEDEASWLRARVIRLRVALRFTKDPRAETILREVIADAEDRLAALDQPPI